MPHPSRFFLGGVLVSITKPILFEPVWNSSREMPSGSASPLIGKPR